MRKGVVVGIGVAVLLVMAVITAIVVMPKDNKTPESNTTSGNSGGNSSDGEQSGPTSDTCPTVGANVVAYCGGKFTDITVAVGDEVMFVNNSTETIEPASDPHPTHTANSELNIGVLEPGERKSVNVEKAGSWGIHDHLDPTHKGKITVE